MLLSTCAKRQAIEAPVSKHSYVFFPRLVERPADGQITWLRTSVNFGTVKAGAKLILACDFINTGPVPVEIEVVKSSGGLYPWNFTRSTKVGETGTVSFEFITKGRKGKIGTQGGVMFKNVEPHLQFLKINGEIADDSG